jgi:hypothetical protein
MKLWGEKRNEEEKNADEVPLPTYVVQSCDGGIHKKAEFIKSVSTTQNDGSGIITVKNIINVFMRKIFKQHTPLARQALL